MHHKPSKHEQIAVAAYYIWLKAGEPTDHDLDIWLMAEKQIHSCELEI